MNTWENAVVTTKGLALLSKLMQGNTLNISKAMSGSGSVAAGTLQNQTSVSTPKQTLNFRAKSYPEEGKCAITCYLTNDNLSEPYTAKQIGVYAVDPDEGEILFFLVQAPSGSGTPIPSETESPGYSAEWTFTFEYGQADGVNITVDPSNTVTKAVMEQYVDAEILPLSYTEIDAAIGLISGDGSGGDIDIGGGSSGVTTLDHSLLYNRDMANQHPIESITGLEYALTEAEGSELDSLSIESAWIDAINDT